MTEQEQIALANRLIDELEATPSQDVKKSIGERLFKIMMEGIEARDGSFFRTLGRVSEERYKARRNLR